MMAWHPPWRRRVAATKPEAPAEPVDKMLAAGGWIVRPLAELPMMIRTACAAAATRNRRSRTAITTC